MAEFEGSLRGQGVLIQSDNSTVVSYVNRQEGTQSSESEDRFWCPVRALKYYIDKTKSVRGEHDQLFLTHAYPHRPATKSTIARWIIQMISESGGNVNDDHVTAHSTRAMAASLRSVPCWDDGGRGL